MVSIRMNRLIVLLVTLSATILGGASAPARNFWKDDRFLAAVQYVESKNDPNAESPVGARGLFQLMEPTWKDMTKEPWSKAYDPDLNREVAIKYFKWIETTLRKKEWLGHQPTMDQVLAAWNGGIGRLRKKDFDVSKMPPETREFVRRVNNRL